MKPQDRLEVDPQIVKAFEDIYAVYQTIRPHLLKMKIKANRLPERDYLRPLLHKWNLKRLDKTHQILNRFIESDEYKWWLKIRAENKEEVWCNYDLIDGSENFAEVISLNEAAKKCEFLWFLHEDVSVLIKDKKKGKHDSGRKEDSGRMPDEDQEAGTGSEDGVS